MTNGFSKVQEAFPWPAKVPYPTEDLRSYDGGGREIITEVLKRLPSPVVVEVGAFLGGSALTWLEASPAVTVVCVDPWEGDWWVSHARDRDWAELAQRFGEKDGPKNCFLTNLWNHRNRVVAVQGYAPARLHDLKALGLHPSVIYFDSDKSGSGMAEAAELFPDAIIAGDDWNWSAPDGSRYPIRKSVYEVAGRTGRHIVVRHATWLLQEGSLSGRQVVDRVVSGVKDALRPFRDMVRSGSAR